METMASIAAASIIISIRSGNHQIFDPRLFDVLFVALFTLLFTETHL
ncbi:hypothetical protein [Gardnerella leopoldii]|nr:hypothetical protein [Gardnerella leopoldii]